MATPPPTGDLFTCSCSKLFPAAARDPFLTCSFSKLLPAAPQNSPARGRCLRSYKRWWRPLHRQLSSLYVCEYIWPIEIKPLNYLRSLVTTTYFFGCGRKQLQKRLWIVVCHSRKFLKWRGFIVMGWIYTIVKYWFFVFCTEYVVQIFLCAPLSFYCYCIEL
jgi:hypothetical protein